MYTGVERVEDDDHDLVSSLSSPKRADTLSKERRGASKAFLRQLSRRAPEAGNDLHQGHYSINQYITLVKWKELIMKGVRRQRNRGFRLVVIMSRMIVMIILSDHY